MNVFKSIWELTEEQREDVITGKLVCNIEPEAVLALFRNRRKLDPRHNLETYKYLLEHGDKAFEKKYITKHGQWRKSALRDGRSVDTWPLEDVLALIRGEFGIVVSTTSDEFLAKRALKHSTGLPVEQWHPKDIIAYAQTYHLPGGPVLPKVTDRGNPLRCMKYITINPGAWTRSEQLDGIEGHLSRQKEFDRDLIIEEVRLKYNLPYAWTEESVIDFLSNDVYPPQASNGVWIVDVNRQYFDIEHLPVDLMQAFFAEEIELPYTKAEVATEYRNRQGVSTLSDSIIANQVKNMTNETKPVNVIYVTDMLDGFKSYMEQAKGRNATVAAEAHHTMQNMFNRVFRMEYVDFNESYATVLDYVYNNLTGCFAPSVVFGGITDVKMTSKQFNFYEQMMNLIVKTANPATRHHNAKNTDLTELLKYSPYSDLNDKLRNFYKLDV